MAENMAGHIHRVGLPANSPDLNVIENLWGYVQDKLAERRFKTVTGLWRCLKEVWQGVPKRVLRNLVASMPRRLRLVRAANGGTIRLH